MKFTPTEPPRPFPVGRRAPTTLLDCGRVDLRPDEQVTFTTDGGGQYDVVRKTWGFYATPSLNARLSGFGLRGVLARSPDGKAYVLLVERGREEEFERYLGVEGHEIITWLDTDAALEELQRRLKP